MGREYMGVSRSTFLVDKTGKIVKDFKKVKPVGHSQEGSRHSEASAARYA